MRKNCCTSRSSTNDFKVLNDYQAELEDHFGSSKVGVAKFHAARKSLKNYVTSLSGEPQSALTDVPLRYEVLSLVTSDRFWSDSHVLAWIFGWNTTARLFQDVNSALGWALLGKRMESKFEELMDQSRESRHILAVTRDLALESGCTPWWQDEDLALPLDDFPSPPASDVDEEEIEEYKPIEPTGRHKRLGDHQGSVGSNNHRGHPNRAGERPVSPVEVPGDEPDDRSDIKEDQPPENIHLSATSAGERQSPALSWPASHRDNVSHPSSKRAKDRLPDSSSRPSQSHSSQNDQQPAHPWNIGDLSTAISVYTQQSASSQNPIPPTGLLTYQFFENRVPGHILTRQCMSQNTLESVLSKSIQNRSLSSSQLNHTIELYETGLESMLFKIGLERQRFRQTIIT
ncbi:hypothetical protein FRC10_006769, partial [Ceratobasidium sp. 414]